MRSPLVSVIVPVFNREAVVGQAIGSLVRQTLEDVQIVVVDDGSTDGSAEAAERAGSGCARIVVHSSNRGIPAARNTGLAEARGRYIAWLDSDDLARPRRLEQQVKFLDRNHNVALVGSAAGRITGDGKRKRGARVPFTTHEALSASLLFRSPFQQSSITGRAEILKAYDYRPEFPVCEDLDMFIRLSRRHTLSNMHDVLIDRRVHPDQVGKIEAAAVRDRKKVLLSSLLDDLEIERTDQDLDRHVQLGTPKQNAANAELIRWSEQWITNLSAANARVGRYDRQAFAAVCARTWMTVAFSAMRGRYILPVGGTLLSSPLLLGAFNPEFAQWTVSLLADLVSTVS